MKRSIGVTLLAGLLAIAAMVLAGCQSAMEPAAPAAAKPAAKAAMTTACAPQGKLETQVSPEAKLASLDCYFDQYKKVKSLHIKVAVTNTSDKPQRYRVNIFLDNGKAVGGLIPRTTKKGLVKPGETQGFTYPVQGMETAPAGMTVLIKTMAQ